MKHNNLIVFFISLVVAFKGFTQVADFSASSTTICVGDSVTFTNLSTGAATYNWTFLDGGANQTSSLVNPTITYTVPGSYSVILVATSGSLNSDTETKSGFINVLAPPTITLLSGNPNQVVCVNTPATPIVYTIGAPATGAIVTGLPPGMTGTFAAGEVTISGTPTLTGPFSYTITTTGGVCPPVTESGTINVDPYIQLISGPGTNNQTACLNQPIIDIEYTLGAGFTGASVVGLPPGLFGNFSAGNFIISGSSATLGVFPYTITTTGGLCGPAVENGVVTITLGPTINLIAPFSAGSQTVCEGSPIDTIRYVIGGLATGAFASGLPPGINSNFANDTLTITGVSSTIGTFIYSVTTTGSNCPAAFVLGNLTIQTFPIIQLISSPISDTQQWCINSQIDTILYQFSGSALGAVGFNLPAGINVTIQGDTVIVSDTANAAGTFDFLVFTTGGVCPADTAYGQLIIDDSLGLTLLSPAGSDNQVFCNSNGASIDTILYQLSSGADTVVITGLPPGIVDTFYNDTLQITGIANATATGTFTYTMIVSGPFCPNDTLTGTIEIQTAQLLLVTDPYTNDQQVCLNAGIDSIAYAVGGPILVQDLPPGVTSNYIPGVPNLSVLSGVPTAAGSFYYTLQFTGACGNSIAVGYITVSDGVKNFVAGPDTTINLGQNIDLFALGDNLLNYTWTPAATLSNAIIFNPVATPDATITYTVTVEDESGCTASLPVVVTVLTDIELLVPNLFSPNGDGFNDNFQIPNLGLFPGTGLTVINREGQVVYESAAYDNTWDGTFNGKKLPEATYYYLLKFATSGQLLKGAVTILRNEK